MSKTDALYVVTANDLLSGDVIFLSSGGSWRDELQHATLVRTEGDAKFLMAQAALHQAYVVTPYLAEVRRDEAGLLELVQHNERIRLATQSHRQRTDPAITALSEPAFTAL